MKYFILPLIGGSKKDKRHFFTECDTFFSFRSDIARIFNFYSIQYQVENAAISLGWNGVYDDEGNYLLEKIKNIWQDYNGGSLQYILNLIKYNQTQFKKTRNIYVIECQNEHDVDIFVEHFPLEQCKTIYLYKGEYPKHNEDEFYDIHICYNKYEILIEDISFLANII